MPQSPFGLAYGLGAGLAIAPQQMYQRQAQQNDLAMRGLQMQILQRQVAEQQAQDRAFSEPVQPQMEQPSTPQALSNVIGSAPMMGGVPTGGAEGFPGMPEGGVPLGPGRVQEGAVPSLREATSAKPRKYVTPYERMAFELSQRADRLAQMGFGRSAMALQQQAAGAQEKHMDAARGLAVQSLIRGDKPNAVNALNSIGISTSDVGKFNTPDGEMFFIQDPTGQKTLMSREDLAVVAADPTKIGDIINKQNQYNALYGSRIEAAGTAAASRERMKTQEIQSKEKIAAENFKNRLDIANIRAATPTGLRGSVTTADERKVQALVRDTGMSLEDAWDRVKPDIQSRGQITDKDRHRNLISMRSDIVRSLGRAPQKGDPEFEEYNRINAEISDVEKVRGSRKPSAKPSGGAKSLDEYLKGQGF